MRSYNFLDGAVADAVIDMAAVIRKSGRRFEGEQDWLADAIDKGAAKARDLAEDFRDADVRDLVSDGRRLARQRPRLAIIGAVVVGGVALVLARRAIGAGPGLRTARA